MWAPLTGWLFRTPVGSGRAWLAVGVREGGRCCAAVCVRMHVAIRCSKTISHPHGIGMGGGWDRLRIVP